ncbi:hypothetical protein H5410_009894 [Solanum commersonii]|uniref:Uncharacterized protein n=1 Tax=Solanum commersonii TaxID=4109 RepID=A0A9J6AK23_SOLCO|nr:hypothetical protein H5410_009894 [Solanum commersonii]
MLFLDGTVVGILLKMQKGAMIFQTIAPNKTMGWIVMLLLLFVSMSLDDTDYVLDFDSFVPSSTPVTMDIRYPDKRINDFSLLPPLFSYHLRQQGRSIIRMR